MTETRPPQFGRAAAQFDAASAFAGSAAFLADEAMRRYRRAAEFASDEHRQNKQAWEADPGGPNASLYAYRAGLALGMQGKANELANAAQVLAESLGALGSYDPPRDL